MGGRVIPVELTYPHEGVALIQMCDQAGANTFSAELLAGLQSSFSSVSSDESVRAVVMTGIGPYFCCGVFPDLAT